MSWCLQLRYISLTINDSPARGRCQHLFAAFLFGKKMHKIKVITLYCDQRWYWKRMFKEHFGKVTINCYLEPLYFRRCLHDTRSSFIPVRLHPGCILSIYICLHDTNQNCIPERTIPERLHPGSHIGSKFSFQNEICLHVPPVSCKGGTGSFRYGNKQVDWLG